MGGTAAGDLYALGIIAYEALVGHRPFTGTTQVDIAFAHVNEPVPPLPDSIPVEVSDVVMALLAKKPADRPRSAREVARRLDRIVVNLPADSWDPRQVPTWTSTGRRVDRSRSDDGPHDSAPRFRSRSESVPRRGRRARARRGEPSHRADEQDTPSTSTRAMPAAKRTRTTAGWFDADPRPTRHASGRGLFGLPQARVRLAVIVAFTVLTLLAIVVTAGTLTSTQSGMPREQTVMSVIPPQEAL